MLDARIQKGSKWIRFKSLAFFCPQKFPKHEKMNFDFSIQIYEIIIVYYM